MDYALCINGGVSLYVHSGLLSNSFQTRHAVSEKTMCHNSPSESSNSPLENYK